MIEVKEVYEDESVSKLNLRYHPRALKIDAGVSGTTSTPSRVIVDTEYNNKTKFANELKIDDPISLAVSFFERENLQSFINKNGELKKLKEKIDAFGKQATDSKIRILSLILKNTEGIFNTREDIEKFFRFLDTTEINLNTRSLPYFKTEKIPTKTLYETFCKTFDNPVVWVDLKEEPNAFKERIDILIDLVKNKRLQMIGVHYAKYYDANTNYDYLYTNFHTKDVLLVLEGVPKKFNTSNLSALHFYPYMCFDAISPQRKQYGFGDSDYLKTIKNTSLLFRKNLLIDKFSILNDSDRKEILTPYKIDPFVKIINNAEKIRQDDKISDEAFAKFVSGQFKAFSYVQQAIDGQAEMKVISKLSENKEASSYLEEKKELKKKITNFVSGNEDRDV